ncbi:unnamed protein product [Ambrosiozyma monospora]|uniref:Unnamed protein product n=1 Tax=Ambrosiozyma monospora TaxID=43982 RepID=A0A9W6YSX9_AMBMO|nr:unnamed protein product [Ambrosiozyma monospora]
MAGLSTRLMHSDANTQRRTIDVVQPINVTTTFRYPDDPDDYVMAKDRPSEDISTGRPWYSRLSHPNSSKVEAVLGDLLEGEAVVYNNGLAAFNAALTYFNPKQVLIGDGYHGVHGILDLWTRNHGLVQLKLNEVDKLKEGDLIHIETPQNPYSTIHDLSYYVKIAREKKCKIMVDSTFGPPPLSNPWDFGVDMIMHSATKFFGGHSDLLAGVLVTKDKAVKTQLVEDRIFLGSNIANLEAFLILRSLRTYEMRLLRQSSNATALVKWLDENRDKYPKLDKIYHSSLQKDDFVKKQMTGGFPPVFSLEFKTVEQSKRFPSKLTLFDHATSLGGVESLIEWRPMSDTHERETLLRVSVGIENVEDLIADFKQGLEQIEKEDN